MRPAVLMKSRAEVSRSMVAPALTGVKPVLLRADARELAGLLAPPIDADVAILLKVYCEKRLLALLAKGSAFLRASKFGSSDVFAEVRASTDLIGRNALRGGVEKADGGLAGGLEAIGVAALLLAFVSDVD